jgi:hypothetical protein
LHSFQLFHQILEFRYNSKIPAPLHLIHSQIHLDHWSQSKQNYKKRNPKAKLVLIDVQPNSTTQVQSDKDVLNVAGWSDEVFNVITNFVNNESKSFIAEIERVF